MSTNAVKNRHGSAVITLPSDNEILITRKFDAPAALVYKAYTTPDLVKRWWSSGTSEWLVCDIDLQIGGRWRYLVEEPDGPQVGFHGEFRELDAPHRVTHTEVFEGFPPDPNVEEGALDICSFDEADGVTTLSVLMQCADQEMRDAIINSGMEGGMQTAYDRLEDLVRS